MSDFMQPVRLVHLFPDMMNLYGDGGNVLILRKRLAWRGVPVDVRRIESGDPVQLDDADFVFMGGGPDREQRAAAQALMAARDQLAGFVDGGGAGLFICGAYQMLGRSWFDGEDDVPGVGIFPAVTRAPRADQQRLIDNIVVQSPLVQQPVIGYENHAGRTVLDADACAFGQVINHAGHGNNDDDRHDGCVVNHAVGTYLHGPALAKNPQLADMLLTWACEHHALRTGEALPQLSPLDDTAERRAHEVMLHRLR